MFDFNASLSTAVACTSTPSSPAARLVDAPLSPPLSPELLERMHRYWQAANHLTAGQIGPPPLARAQPRAAAFTDA